MKNKNKQKIAYFAEARLVFDETDASGQQVETEAGKIGKPKAKVEEPKAIEDIKDIREDVSGAVKGVQEVLTHLDKNIDTTEKLINSIDNPSSESAAKASRRMFRDLLLWAMHRPEACTREEISQRYSHLKITVLVNMANSIHNYYLSEYEHISHDFSVAYYETKKPITYTNVELSNSQRVLLDFIRLEGGDVIALLKKKRFDNTGKTPAQVDEDLDKLSNNIISGRVGLGEFSMRQLLDSSSGTEVLKDLRDAGDAASKRIDYALSKIDFGKLRINKLIIEYLAEHPNLITPEVVAKIRKSLRSGYLVNHEDLPDPVIEKIVKITATYVTARVNSAIERLEQKVADKDADLKAQGEHVDPTGDLQLQTDNLKRLLIAYSQIGIRDEDQVAGMIKDLKDHKHEEGFERCPKLYDILMLYGDELHPDYIVSLLTDSLSYESAVANDGKTKRIFSLDGRFLGTGSFSSAWSTLAFSEGSTEPIDVVVKRPVMDLTPDHKIKDWSYLEEETQREIWDIYERFKNEGIKRGNDGLYDAQEEIRNLALDTGTREYANALLSQMLSSLNEAGISRQIMERQGTGELARFIKYHYVTDTGAIFMESIANPKAEYQVCDYDKILERGVDTLDGENKITRGQFWGGIADVLDALGEMHEKGFVHRDIKPSNFGFGPDGKIRLIDPGALKTRDNLGDIVFVEAHKNLFNVSWHKEILESGEPIYYPTQEQWSPLYYNGKTSYHESKGTIEDDGKPYAYFGASDNFSMAMVIETILDAAAESGDSFWVSDDEENKLTEIGKYLQNPRSNAREAAKRLRSALQLDL